MDPSQLFGTWMNPKTFLGGSLEISLERFVTTVQIKAFEVRFLLNVNIKYAVTGFELTVIQISTSDLWYYEH